MPRITTIPATINPLTRMPSMTTQKRRVAGYARVSTDSDEQENSYEAQVEYFTKFIHSRSDWEFVRIYTDDGISATNTKRREGFKEMIADALDGRIDLIVTKSISRFARNTVDSISTIRKLKEKGIECFFQKENIWTFDGKGELLVTIMSSLAQEESRSISENVTWGQRKRFSDGKVTMPYKHFLGYRKGEDGLPVIVEEEARIVQLIYRLFLEGKTQQAIGKQLESMGIASPAGKATWSKTTISSILTNEKYKGDALLQKSFTVDFLEKKMKVNEGEVPQYYVEGSHPAIIDPDEWEHVQHEYARRKALGNTYSGKSVLAAKLICEDCGSFFGSKVWHSTDPYRSTVWQCNKKFQNQHRCNTPVLRTEKVQQMFISAYNKVMMDLDTMLEACMEMRKLLTNFTDIDTKIQHQTDEMLLVAEMVKAAVQLNASTAQAQDEYNRRYSELAERYEKMASELEKLKAERKLMAQKDKSIGLFMRTLKKQPVALREWNDTIWIVMVENAIVHRDGSITFRFYNGAEIKVGA